jgi:cytochrome c-type biogenesis protein CcmH/NrfG
MASSARLDELKKKFDENPRRYFAPLANEHRKSGDLDQAIALCRTHLPLQPGHISGHIVLAQALFETGSLDESREIFHNALGLDPENLIALRYLGDIARQASDIETARQWYQRVLEVDPRNDEIVQLVRELDAPAGPPAESDPDTPAVDATEEAASTANSYAPAPSAESNARFAPLSLDELDVDGAATASTVPNDTGAPTAEDASVDWSARAESADLLLDTPGIDPFDLDPAGSVDALLAAAEPEASDDFFLTELAATHPSIDESEPQPPSADVAQTSVPDVAAAPNASASAPPAEPSFEEGDFYLEPPPPEPVAPSADLDTIGPAGHADSAPAADQVSMPGLDAFAAEYSVPASDLHAAAAAAGAWMTSEPEPAPNAEAVARFAEQETAEWQPPAPEPAAPAAQAPDDGLGLEVMEFVPPSRDASAQAPSPVPTANADPLIGRMLDATPSEQGATPAAFVTETMAELYLQQGFRNEALAVYRELLARNPSDANLRDRVEQIESGSVSSIGMAAVSENVVESALKRQAARPSRSVRSFFASLAGRRVVGPRDAADGSSSDHEREPDYSGEMSPTGFDPSVESRAPVSVDVGGVIQDDHDTPLVSAAETLATFDPFADAMERASQAIEVTPGTPNAEQQTPAPEAVDELDATDLTAWAAPTVELPVAQPEAPAPASDTTHAHRSLDQLFPEAPVTPRTEVAAQTLATAFGRGEPQGRPTRAASNELSLDHVFRSAPEGAPAADGGFSFDQFFSDSRSAGSDAAASATTAQETGRGDGSGDAHDIEQFTAWLEGLKKK